MSWRGSSWRWRDKAVRLDVESTRPAGIRTEDGRNQGAQLGCRHTVRAVPDQAPPNSAVPPGVHRWHDPLPQSKGVSASRHRPGRPADALDRPPLASELAAVGSPTARSSDSTATTSPERHGRVGAARPRPRNPKARDPTAAYRNSRTCYRRTRDQRLCPRPAPVRHIRSAGIPDGPSP
jgi:hypothetical protein